MSFTQLQFRQSNWLTVSITFLVLLIPNSDLMAQPSWVKECRQGAEALSVPREVPAVVLVNHAEMVIEEPGVSTWHKRYAAKVLTGSGAAHAVLQVAVNENVKVLNLRGWLLTDTEVIQLKKTQIVEIASENSSGYYNEERILNAAFPGVGVGDVVAYEYDVEERSPFGSDMHEFVFQTDLPVMYATLTVTIPRDARLIWSGQWVEGIDHSVVNGKYTWSAKNLSARMDQPLMPAWSFVTRKVTFMGSEPVGAGGDITSDWGPAGRQAWELQERGAHPDSAIHAVAQELTLNSADTADMVKAIYDFVRDRIRYVAVEIGAGRFEPRPAASVLANRYGDCKDKVALTRALLKCVQVPSYPVLVSIDRPVKTDVPNPFQFNHCILAVPNKYVPEDSVGESGLVDSLAYLDPTNEALKLGSLSGSISGVPALVATSTAGILTNTPTARPEEAFSQLSARMKLDPSGLCTGTARLVSCGTMASEVSLNLSQVQTSEAVEYLKTWLSGSIGGLQISDFVWNKEGDSVVESFKISGKGPIIPAGNNQLLKVNIFAGDRQESIEATGRIFPFYLGRPRVIETKVEWQIPRGLSIVDTSTAEAGECDLAKFASETKSNDSLIQYSQREEYRGGTAPAENVVSIRAWLKQRNSALSTRLTLTRTEEE